MEANPLRYSEKRPTQLSSKSSLNQPLEKNMFNFTKIQSEEVNFEFRKKINFFFQFFNRSFFQDSNKN